MDKMAPVAEAGSPELKDADSGIENCKLHNENCKLQICPTTPRRFNLQFSFCRFQFSILLNFSTLNFQFSQFRRFIFVVEQSRNQ
ncbi:MAG TPA: hypothetical protein VLU47_05720, partial [Blastocatellia bacterium]|nr:hypothetical protein [Blastocatellia bacterium]